MAPSVMKRIVVWLYGLVVVALGVCILCLPPATLWLCAPMSAYCVFYGVAGIHAFEIERLRDKAKVGTCRRCGYDLRATPNRRPECGLSAPNDDKL